MSMVHCDSVTEGLRDSECLASVRDIRGRKHEIRVERDFLSEIGGRQYLPIGIVHVDPKSKAVLIEFSHEPETGVNRIWVTAQQLDHPLEVCA